MSRLMQLPTPPRTIDYVVQWAADLTRTLGRHLFDLQFTRECYTLHLDLPSSGTYPLVRVPLDRVFYRVDVCLQGSSPTADVDVLYGSQVGSGASVFGSPQTVTSTTGVELSIRNNHVTYAGDWIWINLTNVTNVDVLTVSVVMEPA